MPLSAEEQAICDGAIAFARANKKSIAKRLTSPQIYAREENPVSVFMAGSPGAGKTEASIELLSQFDEIGSKVLRIDPDELRSEFEGYTGGNSWLFQRAVSILVEKIHDLALDQRQSFLLDGTLANYEIAERNIQRSLRKGRTVLILYVYQRPDLAWEFVQARERVEGRKIPIEEFVRQYFAARDVVNRLKQRFGGSIEVDLLLKNNDGSHRVYEANIDRIDSHVPETYDRASLEQMLLQRG
ncbi:zeta toxin family protein [Pseudomonas aeruginosa]|uniref:zeta toxin family protein n=1 Tax=Pseudomonas aeruginosa TaxID=287 RepID=UPI00071E685A|nr:zeta toxin family protein [Pseudomonas aeruginosa]KSP55836.1 Zeta toxin [Pseudomonas aeruginosa]MBU5955110.1 zeta toxin family protein [Pseudomonas aeruginosa]MBW6290912.1 zeta toxin family protein [Pseudomonas aeruginosa]MCO2536984.1 Zeta toxin [Pseudomonas aeruginosa]MDI3750648.1 zeta toxin family protein [Pseudomonas aeruginosa]